VDTKQVVRSLRVSGCRLAFVEKGDRPFNFYTGTLQGYKTRKRERERERQRASERDALVFVSIRAAFIRRITKMRISHPVEITGGGKQKKEREREREREKERDECRTRMRSAEPTRVGNYDQLREIWPRFAG